MIVHWQRRWLDRATIGSAAIGLAAGALAVAIGAHGFGDFAADRRVIFAALFAAFAMLLLMAAATYGWERVRFDWVVAVDADGLLDRRVSRSAISWDAVDAVLPARHGMQWMLVLDVAEARTVEMPLNPMWRLNRLAARLLGNPELLVRLAGLDTDLFALIRAIDDQAGRGSGDRQLPLEPWDIVRAKPDCEDAEYRGRTGHVISAATDEPAGSDRMICVMFDRVDHMAILRESDLTSLGRKDETARQVHEDWVRSGRSIRVRVDPATGRGDLIE